MKVISIIRNIFREKRGQTLSEYALIILLIAVVAILAVTLFGNQIAVMFNQIANAI